MKRIAGIPLIILGNVISQIINFFKNRVSADGGVFEAESCLEPEVVRLRNLGLWDKASLIITPNGYKAGKIYSIKPNSGAADLVFSRSNTRTRRNAIGAIESITSEVPAIDYSLGSCPIIPFDPQRTNLVQNNETLGGYSLVGGNILSNIFTEDSSSGNHVVNTNFYSGFAANTIYCYSVILKKVSGGTRWAKLNVSDSSTGEVSSKWLNLQTGVLSGSESYSGNWLSLGLTTGVINLPNGRYVFYITAQNSSLNSSLIRCYFSDSGISTTYSGTGVTFEYYYPQAESGSFPTSRIITAGASVTRVGDRVPAFINSGLFSASFTWYIHIKNNVVFPNPGTHLNGPYVGNGTQGLFLATTATPDRLRIWTQSASNVYQTTTDEVKLAVKSNGTTLDVFANGVKVVSGYSYPFTFDRIGINSPNVPLFLQGMHLYANALSDAECIALTT
ncbi:MAG: hypothetical protein LCH37_12920 [Bacteroidetes bacterium]|nr:hypothetical protein [Bacteroidota bacterium]